MTAIDTKRLTLLAGGDTVYVYPDCRDAGVAERIGAQRMVLDVAYPGDETEVRSIRGELWTAEVQAALRDQGVTIVDTREDA